MKKQLLTVLLSVATISLFSQQASNLKLIKATSAKMDIRDGDGFLKGTWGINTSLKPDVYESELGTKRISFYTDIDSISFDVVPQGVYDFGVIYNNDTAWTQIRVTKPDYLARLKDDKEYNFADKREIPAWKYQDPSDANLQALRADFKLDSIAGNGDELSKIVNLMYWVHKTIQHNGSNSINGPYNAHDIMNSAKSQGKGVNCRMLGIILNECYLAMGFKSRYVTCMPKDVEFNDCHVINEVYSNDLDRWIWMDPSFAGFVMDENGVYLGIKEVRDGLINNKPMFVNDNLNWNGSPMGKDYYLKEYMTKNLYRLESPVYSAYNIETKNDNEDVFYIELIPVNGLDQETTSKNGYITYKTNNPDLFWAKPTK